jgi:hypothetical protein
VTTNVVDISTAMEVIKIYLSLSHSMKLTYAKNNIWAFLKTGWITANGRSLESNPQLKRPLTDPERFVLGRFLQKLKVTP